jgi:hypothetical protein
MKQLSNFILEQKIDKEDKQKAISFVKEYFDKFDNDSKNFLKNKFDDNEFTFGWSLGSLIYTLSDKESNHIYRLLNSINTKYKTNNYLPKMASASVVKYTSYNIIKKNINKYLGAYKINIFSKEQYPTLLRIPSYSDYVYITNLDKYHTENQLKDSACIELFDFTTDENPLVKNEIEHITIRFCDLSSACLICSGRLPALSSSISLKTGRSSCGISVRLLKDAGK